MSKLRKLNRTSSHRQALLRNLATDLIKYEKIQTTDAKAKELRRYAEKIITCAKEKNLSNIKLVAKEIQDKTILKKLFDEIAPRYKEKPGGYIRIIKVKYRQGDGAKISLVELCK